MKVNHVIIVVHIDWQYNFYNYIENLFMIFDIYIFILKKNNHYIKILRDNKYVGKIRKLSNNISIIREGFCKHQCKTN